MGAFSLPALRAQSVLSSGKWYKLAVDKNGVFKVDYGLLKKMGIDPDKIDPHTLRIYGNVGGMLPQANSAVRPTDLTENAIFIQGEDDGKFDKDDFILFYAQGPDRTSFDVKHSLSFYEKNLYSDKNYYFLTVGNDAGKRIDINTNSSVSNLPLVETYNDFVFHELDTYKNELKSGREWYGEDFVVNPDQTFKLDVSGIVDNSTITIVSDVMGQSYIGSSFNLYFNDTQIGQQFIPLIPNTQYGVKGVHQRDTLQFNSSIVSALSKTSQALKYSYLKSSGYSKGYLDFFMVSFTRKLALYGDQTIFRSQSSLQNAASRFSIDGLNDNSTIWDITDPSSANVQPFTLSGNAGEFNTETTTLKEFVIFNDKTPSPEFIEAINNQNLHGLNTPNIIIVTNPAFKDAALRFADYRENTSGYSVAVVTTDEVFNEFSSGRQDVGAIRDFTKYLYDKNKTALKSLILFGRGSYDYKNRINNNTNFVPTYESRNSLHPLLTYSSDDFYSFLEENEGTWGEDPAEDHTLDIGVGRFPVKSLAEAQVVVDKIIAYETNSKSIGKWRKEITFVADDGDGNIHQTQSDQLAQKVENTHPEFNANRIFLDAYPQIVRPGGEIAPDANKAILSAIDQGTVIVNYTGHGGEKIWAEEKILDDLMIGSMDNKQYPLFVTATCEFGRNDDPGIISSAELTVLKENGGSIGIVCTARPVNSSTNFQLNQAFYDALFQRENNSFLTLGEIFKRTKNNSTNGVSNRNFSLLGDPSMKLAFPNYNIVINEIKNEAGQDSLKALSTITVKGEIHSDTDTKASDFNGTLNGALFDKKASFTTLGNENPPFTYQQWSNTLYRGSATVKNGDFEFSFIVPKNIAYQAGKGKMSLYAYDDKNILDGSGSDLDLVVGKSSPNPIPDNTSPMITLYMGDTTFVNGGYIGPDTYLIGKLSDKNGINISNYGIGNSVAGELDGGAAFELNDYYESDKDNFSKGSISYRMKGLTPGKHSITVKAWDTYNNPTQATVDFIVTNGESLEITSYGNYPNPFQGTTTLFFTHNRAGDDLETELYVYDLTGQSVKSFKFSIPASYYKVELPKLDSNTDFGKKLPSGLYFAKLLVRSLTNGSKNEQVIKLIVLN